MHAIHHNDFGTTSAPPASVNPTSHSVGRTPVATQSSITLSGDNYVDPRKNGSRRFLNFKNNAYHVQTNTTVKGKPRQKRFTSKVRTGCDACKRRRIKCSEGSTCKQCVKTGTSCSYNNVPMPKLFQTNTINVPTVAQTQFIVLDLRGNDKDKKLSNQSQASEHSSFQNLASSLRTFRLSVLPFENVEERAAFSYFTHFTGPALDTYGPNAGLWRETIPHYACFSDSVREIVLASVLADQNWSSHDPSNQQRRALGHYIKGLRSITYSKTTKTEALVASMMAWSFEAMLFDYVSAAIHMKGARSLLAELERENDLEQDDELKRLAEATRIYYYYNAVYVNSDPPVVNNPWLAEDTELLLLESIRDQLNGILFRCHSGMNDVKGFARFLRAADNAYRALRFSRKASFMEKESTRLLYDLACALLSDEQLKAFSLANQLHKSNIDVVLLQAAMILQECDKLSNAECTNVETTISFVMCHLFTFFPDVRIWRKHLGSVAEMAQAHPIAFSRVEAVLWLELGVMQRDVPRKETIESRSSAKFGRPLLSVPG